MNAVAGETENMITNIRSRKLERRVRRKLHSRKVICDENPNTEERIALQIHFPRQPELRMNKYFAERLLLLRAKACQMQYQLACLNTLGGMEYLSNAT